VVKDIPEIYTTRLLGLVVWVLALGVGMGGNMTPVGASANVLAYSYLEHFCGKVGWPAWIKMTVPPTLAAMGAAAVLLYVKYLIGWY
jgi:Na+/H+ antiporter NhaD/arsenite permease-like protein